MNWNDYRTQDAADYTAAAKRYEAKADEAMAEGTDAGAATAGAYEAAAQVMRSRAHAATQKEG
jgi:hypothetical protein